MNARFYLSYGHLDHVCISICIINWQKFTWTRHFKVFRHENTSIKFPKASNKLSKKSLTKELPSTLIPFGLQRTKSKKSTSQRALLVAFMGSLESRNTIIHSLTSIVLYFLQEFIQLIWAQNEVSLRLNYSFQCTSCHIFYESIWTQGWQKTGQCGY